MSNIRIAKLFKNGESQAVRLPIEFRFNVDKVYVHRDELTGDIVLSAHPSASAWRDFFKVIRSIDIPNNFMAERPINSNLDQKKLLPREEV